MGLRSHVLKGVKNKQPKERGNFELSGPLNALVVSVAVYAAKGILNNVIKCDAAFYQNSLTSRAYFFALFFCYYHVRLIKVITYLLL